MRAPTDRASRRAPRLRTFPGRLGRESARGAPGSRGRVPRGGPSINAQPPTHRRMQLYLVQDKQLYSVMMKKCVLAASAAPARRRHRHRAADGWLDRRRCRARAPARGGGEGGGRRGEHRATTRATSG